MKIWLAIKDQTFCALTQDKVDGDASGTEKHESPKAWQKLWIFASSSKVEMSGFVIPQDSVS